MTNDKVRAIDFDERHEDDSKEILFIRDQDTGAYICVDHSPEWIAKLAFVIDNGSEFTDLIGPLLVRRGHPGRFFHYPVPFLFKSENDRKAAAQRRGKNPPREWWVRRKLALIHHLARREEKLVA